MIILKSKWEIEAMRESGKLAVDTMEKVLAAVRAGITTAELDKIAHENILRLKAEPNFLGVGGFPKSICTSVNDVVVHGIPGKLVLQEGDIISIDLGVVYKGYHSDMARTVPVGKVSEEAEQLIAVTKECFYRGMAKAVIGNHIIDIGTAVQEYAESFGYGVVREMVGHGIGTELHESPDVPNYASNHRGPVLKEGLTIAIEPMINMGTKSIKTDRDGWTTRTKDGSYSAHYENTIAVTENGPDILTYFDL